jgi:hypothetical protein
VSGAVNTATDSGAIGKKFGRYWQKLLPPFKILGINWNHPHPSHLNELKRYFSTFYRAAWSGKTLFLIDDEQVRWRI